VGKDACCEAAVHARLTFPVAVSLTVSDANRAARNCASSLQKGAP